MISHEKIHFDVLTSLKFKFIKQQSREVADSDIIRVGSSILFEHPLAVSRFKRSAVCIPLPTELIFTSPMIKKGKPVLHKKSSISSKKDKKAIMSPQRGLYTTPTNKLSK